MALQGARILDVLDFVLYAGAMLRPGVKIPLLLPVSWRLALLSPMLWLGLVVCAHAVRPRRAPRRAERPALEATTLEA